jgi:AraC-like DNA-binding protein
MPEMPKFQTEDQSFSIHYLKRKGHTEMPSTHFHENFEIYYLLGGERVYFIQDHVFIARKGDMVVINPNDVHRTTSSKSVPEFERILINFTWEFIQPVLPPGCFSLLPFHSSTLMRFNLKEQAHIERIIQEMLKECQEKPDYYQASIQALLLQLLIRIRRTANEGGREAETPLHPMHQKVSEIAVFLSRNFQDEITLDQIAKQFYISPSYLSRVFKKITGFHLREYLQILRIREAQRLLKETEGKVTDIATLVGFEQIAHFNKTFKKLTGTSPLKYRKAWLKTLQEDPPRSREPSLHG